MAYRGRTLTRHEAARILDGRRPGSESSLAALMTAARAPGTAQELRGELRAGATFRTFGATHRGAAAGPRKAAVAARTGRFAAVVTAATLALGGGGIALAASEGAIHVPFTGHDNRSDNAPAAPATSNPGLAHTTAPRGPKKPKPSSTSSNGANPTPAPSLRGLCRAYQAGASQDGTKSNPAFKALYAAAGGVDKVAAFCDDLIGVSPKPTSQAHPTQAATPTHPAKPTKKPHPTQAASPTTSGRKHS
jgi:hypothetical protein